VEIITIGAQIKVIEHPASSPQIFGTNGDRRDTGIFQLGTGCLELIPVFRNRDTVFVEDVFAIVNTPLIVGVRHTPFFAINGHGTCRRSKAVVEAVIFPDIVNRLEKTRIYIRQHSVTGIPVGQVGRICGQEVADGSLVTFVVKQVPLYGDIRIFLFETVDQGLKGSFGCRIRRIRIDYQLSGDDRGSQHSRSSNCCGKYFGTMEHGLPPVGSK